MVKKEIEFRRERELGEIISDSFEFIKQEYKPISKLVFTYVLPFLILYGIVQVYIQMKIIGNIDLSDQESMITNIGPIYYNIFLFLLFNIFVQSLLISSLYSYIEFYVKKGKGNFELSEITPHLFSNGLLALGACIVFSIIALIGLTLFVVPGIYFANTFSLVVIILIFEKKGLGNAMSRSWSLVNSQWWTTLLLIFVGIVITWATSLVLSIPSMTLGAGTNILNSIGTEPIEHSQWYWFFIGLSSVVSSLLWIIPYTFIALQYFNLKKRTEPEITLQNNEQ